MASPDGTRRSWADLPPEIIRFTSERLDQVSCIRCHAVCSAWASAISGVHTIRPPLLLFGPASILDNATNYKLLDLSNSKTYEIRVPNRSLTLFRSSLSCCLVGSNDGWIVRMDDYCLGYLLNPLSGAEIALPALFFRHYPLKVIICYTPNHSTGFLLLAVDPSGPLAILRGGDKGWTFLGKKKTFKDAIFYNDKVYALTTRNHLCTWDLNTSSPKIEKVSSKNYESSQLCKLVESKGGKIVSTQVKRYLVESGRKLLLVIIERISYSLGNNTTSTRENIVRVLNFDPARADWIPIHSLGNFALFLGGYSTGYSIPVSSQNIHGLRGNCVYINARWRNMGDGKLINCCVEEFNLADGTCRMYYENDEMSYSPVPIWFRPTLF